MPDVKISAMTPGAALSGAELFEMVQSGDTFSTTATALKTFMGLNSFTVLEAVGSSALTLTGATQTASHPVLSATQTWNNAGVTFTAIKANVTSTASAAASLLVDLQLGGVSQFSVTKGGLITATGGLAIAGPITGATTGAFSGAITFSTAAAGPVFKQGANGRVGTFVANGATPVTVNNTSVAVSDAIVISLNTVGGTVGAVPAIQTITAATGFTVAGTAGDTSTYNYAILKNAA